MASTVIEPRSRLNSNLSDHDINFGESMIAQMNEMNEMSEMNFTRTVAQLDAFYGRGKWPGCHGDPLATMTWLPW